MIVAEAPSYKVTLGYNHHRTVHIERPGGQCIVVEDPFHPYSAEVHVSIYQEQPRFIMVPVFSAVSWYASNPHILRCQHLEENPMSVYHVSVPIKPREADVMSGVVELAKKVWNSPEEGESLLRMLRESAPEPFKMLMANIINWKEHTADELRG